jgi:hypothetical protein
MLVNVDPRENKMQLIDMHGFKVWYMVRQGRSWSSNGMHGDQWIVVRSEHLLYMKIQKKQGKATLINEKWRLWLIISYGSVWEYVYVTLKSTVKDMHTLILILLSSFILKLTG